ncbi:MAG TPA: T9SS type A sorting domain-containing protein [Sunxiuqinia sp.]|nr:T9SS type A sorting domain-containing protein [Sunxiuqinia sp.]
MKNFSLLIVCLLPSLAVFSQEYSFPLYFEDAVGNKDTLIFGFDQSATTGVDQNLGEANLLGQPYDSTFFAFFTDAANSDDLDCRLEKEKIPSYISKKQYSSDYYIEIGVINHHWPIKISWKKNLIDSYEQNYSESSMHVILTSWNPPGGWFDSFCCGSWPGGFTSMSDTSGIQVGMNNFCRYKTNFSTDSVSLLYVGFIYYTEAIQTKANEKTIKCWYSKELQSLCIQPINENAVYKIDLLNFWGTKMLTKQISSSGNGPINIQMNHLPNGLYFARIHQLKPNSSTFSCKILKR